MPPNYPICTTHTSLVSIVLFATMSANTLSMKFRCRVAYRWCMPFGIIYRPPRLYETSFKDFRVLLKEVCASRFFQKEAFPKNPKTNPIPVETLPLTMVCAVYERLMSPNIGDFKLVWFGIIYLPSGDSHVYTCFPYPNTS